MRAGVKGQFIAWFLLQFMPFVALGKLVRHCRELLLLHLIPSPSGFFVAGLEGWGSPRRRTPEAAVHVSAILEPEGDSERRLGF
jgi:hypothetical protein